jgi:hypothetical protein
MNKLIISKVIVKTIVVAVLACYMPILFLNEEESEHGSHYLILSRV